MTPAYARHYIGIRDIMFLFNVGYPKAKQIFEGAKSAQPKIYSSLDNQVLLEVVLSTLGIKNYDQWSKQQEKKLKLYKGKSRG